MKFRKILHPTDYSEDSRPALLAAAELAHAHGATLVLLHVVETLGPENLTFGQLLSAPEPEVYRKKLWDELHRLRPLDPPVPVEYVLSEEDVITAILRTSGDLGCDLIVMGTHGDTGWRWLTGSITEQVVRKSTCPVLVMKAPVTDAEKPYGSLLATDLHPGQLIEKEPESPR